MNLAIVVTAVAATAVISSKAKSPAIRLEIYQWLHSLHWGSRMSLDGVDWYANKWTLIMVLDEHCQACQANMSFYKRVTSEIGPGHASIVAVSRHPEAELGRFLRDNLVVVSQISRAEEQSMMVTEVPTLVLVNRFGFVIRVWTRIQSESAEDNVIQTLLRLNKVELF